MTGEYGALLGRLQYFKLWLVLFPVLNAVDIAQTWFFFAHETNPLYVLFPTFIFGIKILWACLAPLVLYFSYSKKPKFIYDATFALILFYLGLVLFNSFNIMRILGS